MCTFKQHYNKLTRKKKYAARETIFSTLSLIFVKTVSYTHLTLPTKA